MLLETKDLIIIAIAAVTGGLISAAVLLGVSYLTYLRNKKRTGDMVDHLKSFVERMGNDLSEATSSNVPSRSGKETSALSFRNTSGEMETVKIVIDFDLKDEDVKAEVEADDASHKTKLMPGVSIAVKDDGSPDEEFVFTGASLHRMLEAGLTPDAVVRNLLIQQGRMRDAS